MSDKRFLSTKIVELGSCAFRQPRDDGHCSFLHGYRLQAKFWITAKELDNRNWVFDFGDFKDIKKVLQKQFDHTTCIDKNDPFLEKFKELNDYGVIDLRVMDGVGIEKFAQWCFETVDKVVKEKTQDRCRVLRVEVWEHELNSAIYEEYQNRYTYDIIGYETDNKATTGYHVVQPSTTNTNNITVATTTTQTTPAKKPSDKHPGLGYKEVFDSMSWGRPKK